MIEALVPMARFAVRGRFGVDLFVDVGKNVGEQRYLLGSNFLTESICAKFPEELAPDEDARSAFEDVLKHSELNRRDQDVDGAGLVLEADNRRAAAAGRRRPLL